MPVWRPRRALGILAWLWFVVLVYILRDIMSQSGRHKQHDLQESQNNNNGKIFEKPLMILSWTDQSEGKPLWFPFHQDPNFTKCVDMPPCIFTSDKTKVKYSHAVLFRGRRLQTETILPPHRSPNQKWIFYEYEPPNKFWDITSLVPFRHSFNITSTYSFDSDVPLSLPKRTYIAPNKLYSLKRLNISYAAGKIPGRVAWFVSNCHTQSQREQYVKELQKYIPVDVYGTCGPLTCGSRLQANRSVCDEALLSAPGSYKFYLSFENSFCDDYITEKLWRLLKEDVLQIVLGAVNYSAILPEETFINVKDFASPKSLADFLLYLDKHDDIYDLILRRKRSIRIELEGLDEPYHCRLCRYLHNHKLKEQQPQDLVHFWGPQRCQHPAFFLDGSARGVKFRS